MHPFDKAVALTQQSEHVWQGHTSTDYANMIGPFGGITAAQTLQAVLLHPQLLGEPVSLTVNFCAALANSPFTVTAQPSRTNRSTQHWRIDMQQAGEIVLTATAVTAVRRDTWCAEDISAPQALPPQEVPPPEMQGRVEWLNRYEWRFLEGGVPTEWDGKDHGTSRTQLWVRDSPPRALDFSALTALSDVFFPRLWRRRAKFVPVGTVSMTVYFHASSAQLQATRNGYLLGQAQAQAFRNGYFDQTAQLWNESGALLVTTHQVVYYKE